MRPLQRIVPDANSEEKYLQWHSKSSAQSRKIGGGAVVKTHADAHGACPVRL